MRKKIIKLVTTKSDEDDFDDDFTDDAPTSIDLLPSEPELETEPLEPEPGVLHNEVKVISAKILPTISGNMYYHYDPHY